MAIPGIDTISQILNIVPSIFQGIAGISQLGKARRIEEQNPMPLAEVAPSVNKLVGYTYGKTLSQDIAGGDIARNEIKGATAAGLRAASELGSGAEAYGNLGQMVGREQNAFSDIAKTTAQQVAGYGQEYQNALLAKGQEENRVWEWNKAQSYLSAAQIAQQLRDSGMKNLNAGGKNIFGSTAEAINPDFNSSLLWGKDNSKGGATITPEELKQIIASISK
jgi:hypothetical protein